MNRNLIRTYVFRYFIDKFGKGLYLTVDTDLNTHDEMFYFKWHNLEFTISIPRNEFMRYALLHEFDGILDCLKDDLDIVYKEVNDRLSFEKTMAVCKLLKV